MQVFRCRCRGAVVEVQVNRFMCRGAGANTAEEQRCTFHLYTSAISGTRGSSGLGSASSS